MEKNANTAKSTRDFILVHIIFVGLCFVVLIIPIPIAIGFKLFILVVSYNLLIPLVGLFKKYSEWVKLWVFVFFISLFQIWPDWFLSAQLNILVFPEDGLFKIGTVSGYMAGLWAIPLFLLCFIGLKLKENYPYVKTLILVGAISLNIFMFSELTMWMLPSWYPQNVTMIFDHLAVYIIIPEVILGVSTFYYFEKTKNQHYIMLIIAAFGIMLLYLGSASFFYFLFEKVIFI
ncbi:MAG: hypothetical protein KGD72_12690 [Candidatus Lokiarchaeota archaeon]|nr:hypothetical protein [Candidatus Lokiarchaeota archaeon]